jgi:hypothetical protein
VYVVPGRWRWRRRRGCHPSGRERAAARRC